MFGVGNTGVLNRNAKSWKKISRQVCAAISEDRIFSLAAASTYYGLLALFPAMAAIVAVYGLFSDPEAIERQITSLHGLLPEGALEVIGNELQRIASQSHRVQGFALFGGVLIAIWSANSAVKALFDSLNQVYRKKEDRSFLAITVLTLAFTVSSIGLLVLAVASIVALPVVLDRLGVSDTFTAALGIVRWIVLFTVVALGLAFLYRFGPDRREPQSKWITWGSAIAAALWILASLLFSWYAANFGSFNKTYGSLGAVIGLMVWIWISMIVVLFGAEIDTTIEDLHSRGADHKIGEDDQ
jgi:membrane protein